MQKIRVNVCCSRRVAHLKSDEPAHISEDRHGGAAFELLRNSVPHVISRSTKAHVICAHRGFGWTAAVQSVFNVREPGGFPICPKTENPRVPPVVTLLESNS